MLNKKTAIKTFARIVLGAATFHVNAQAPATTYTYTKLDAIDQYLMADRAAEIALARTAAPDSIARNAEVQILTRHGFETAAKGSNGFVCVVGRSWTSGPDFWNPTVRVPICLNAAAAHSYLVRADIESQWAMAGRSPEQINNDIPAALAKKELPVMEPGAMCYMMSKDGYGGEGVPHWPSHLMFFYSDFDAAAWGANQPGSPIAGIADPIEHLTQFVIPVAKWSDGTDSTVASTHEHHHETAH